MIIGAEFSIASQPKPIPGPHSLILPHEDRYPFFAQSNMIDKSYSTHSGPVRLCYERKRQKKKKKKKKKDFK